jgi:hypothetical protein
MKHRFATFNYQEPSDYYLRAQAGMTVVPPGAD